MIPTELLVVALLVLSCSGFFLKHKMGANVSRSNLLIPPLFALGGLAIATQLRQFSEAVTFLLIVTGWFTAQIFSSRLKQRDSLFWNVIGGITVNGLWYVAVHMLDNARAYWLLMVPFVIGVIVGRIGGVNWANFIENKYGLKADATKNPDMAPGQRLNYIKKEPAFWTLLLGLVAYTVYGYINFDPELSESLFIVIGLGLLQNLFYALNTRAGNRDSNWYIAITGIFSGITFYISTAYLFSKGVPPALFVPYVISTSLGSAIGSFFSMIIEWIKNLKPDAHIEVKTKIETKNLRRERLPYFVLITAAAAWIYLEGSILNFFGYQIAQLKFPLSFIEGNFLRPIVMITAAMLFFIQNISHALNSRAGNRDHTGYHVATIIPYGLLDFLKLSYISLNNRIPELVPIAVIASCLGSLYGKDISKRIERWLQARMDIEPEPVKQRL